MGRAHWLLNRAAAALIGATMVGVIAAGIMALVGTLTCGPTCTTILGDRTGTHCLVYSSSCTGLWMSTAILFVYAPLFSITLGTLPGLAALTLTPARKRPWRSLPVLVLGTVLGFAVWMYFFSLRNDVGWLLFLVLIPTLTGLATAFNIDRIPPRRNVAPT